MSMPDFPPAKFEMKEQAKRILSSQRFRNAPSLSKFLTLVVRRKLAGEKTRGRILADTLFPEKFPEEQSNNVRTTASNLRKSLRTYYEREGSKDPVIISLPEPPQDKTIKLPEGDAYTPLFAYNPALPWIVTAKLGFRFLESWTYYDYTQALVCFTEILGQDPHNVEGTLGLVETLCKFADQGWMNPAWLEPLSTCRFLLTNTIKRARRHWRYWATTGFMEKVLGADGEVLPAFEKALALNRLRTEGYLPYISFLFETKRTDDGLGLANRYLSDHMEDSAAHVNFGAFLLVCGGRMQAGIDCLERALLMDPGNRSAHMLLAFYYFGSDQLEWAKKHLGTLKTLLDPVSYMMIIRHLKKHEALFEKVGWCEQTFANSPLALPLS